MFRDSAVSNIIRLFIMIIITFLLASMIIIGLPEIDGYGSEEIPSTEVEKNGQKYKITALNSGSGGKIKIKDSKQYNIKTGKIIEVDSPKNDIHIISDGEMVRKIDVSNENYVNEINFLALSNNSQNSVQIEYNYKTNFNASKIVQECKSNSDGSPPCSNIINLYIQKGDDKN